MTQQTDKRIVLTDAKPAPLPCCSKPNIQIAGTMGPEYKVCFNCGKRVDGGDQ